MIKSAPDAVTAARFYRLGSEGACQGAYGASKQAKKQTAAIPAWQWRLLPLLMTLNGNK